MILDDQKVCGLIDESMMIDDADGINRSNRWKWETTNFEKEFIFSKFFAYKVMSHVKRPLSGIWNEENFEILS
jgi:hypothetical protein